MKKKLLFEGPKGSRVVGVSSTYTVFDHNGAVFCSVNDSYSRLGDIRPGEFSVIVGSTGAAARKSGGRPFWFNLESTDSKIEQQDFNGTSAPPPGGVIHTGCVLPDGEVYAGCNTDSGKNDFLFHSRRGALKCEQIGEYQLVWLIDTFLLGTRLICFGTASDQTASARMIFFEVLTDGSPKLLHVSPIPANQVDEPHGMIYGDGNFLITGTTDSERHEPIVIRNGEFVEDLTLKGKSPFSCVKVIPLADGSVFAGSRGPQAGSACLARPDQAKFESVIDLIGPRISGNLMAGSEDCLLAVHSGNGSIIVGINHLSAEIAW